MRNASWIVVVCCLLLCNYVIAGEDGFIEVKGSGGGAGTVISFTNGISEVNTKVDYVVVATLPSNPTTGYRWELMKPLAEGIVRFARRTYHPPQTGLVGAGGQEVLIFRTAGLGETEIALGYLRPWEKGVPPVSSRTIRLKVSP
ncbi:MAG: protease inhibitor I42 family protein [Syntrophales bacterium]|jgi:predicted secreted protein|nr:protease inhibitor I42 family protein [Syntrophales bacterium]MCK9392390.1 protease inhibitor I42 family protein [Syntrophales bacterium]